MTEARPPGQKPIALETRETAGDGRRYSPSAARNRDVLRDAFLTHVTTTGHVLEIASGTGEHGVHITAGAADLVWTYSDPDPESRASQAAWARLAGHGRLRGPIDIDAAAALWPAADGQVYDVMFSANMVHIAPFAAALGLINGAGRHLRTGGRLALYGPFGRNGLMAPSNQAFDVSLKSRDPGWGVRDLDRDLLPPAQRAGLTLANVVEMPANNLTVVFQKT